MSETLTLDDVLLPPAIGDKPDKPPDPDPMKPERIQSQLEAALEKACCPDPDDEPPPAPRANPEPYQLPARVVVIFDLDEPPPPAQRAIGFPQRQSEPWIFEKKLAHKLPGTLMGFFLRLRAAVGLTASRPSVLVLRVRTREPDRRERAQALLEGLTALAKA